MKKVLVGCLVVVVICAIGVGIAGYFLYRAAAPTLQSLSESYDRAKEIGALGDRIADKTPYTAPENGELSETQLNRFLRVQDHVVTALGPRWQELQTKVKDMQSRNEAGKQDMSFTEVMQFVTDASSLMLEARRAQVDALNAEKFSKEEYSWVRVNTYSAAGVELAGGIDLSAFEEMVKTNAEQAGIEAPTMPKVDVPEANRALVKPHIARIKEWWGLAFLGL